MLTRLGWLQALGILCLLVVVDTGWHMNKVSAIDPAAQAEDQELWFGTLDAEVRCFRFLVTLTKIEGGWSGELKSLDEGGRDFPLDNVQRDAESLVFAIQSTGAKFTSQVDASGDTAVGQWQQRGANLPLELARVAELPSEKLKSVWIGELNVLLQKLKVQVRELESGEVYFDSVTQQVGGFVATKTVDGEQVVIDVPAIGGKFEGKIEDGGQRLVGKWKQGLVPLNLTLEKSEQAVAATEVPVPNRPQTPQPPFAYRIEEVEFQNNDAGVTLSGTLTLPQEQGQSKFPAVVLISGSGPQDRDETILGHKPFWVIADHFSKNGIAVLRYDERGVGQSTGDFSQAQSTDFADDARAAIDFLSQHPAIDSSSMGLCGHSEGGLVAPMVAVDDPRVSFIVLMAGPGVTGEQVVTSQTRLILEASGVGEEEIQRQLKMQRVFIDLAKENPLPTKVQFTSRALESIAPLLKEQEKAGDTGQQMVEAVFGQLVSPWFQFFLVHDPAQDLAQVRCPVLAINGEKDLQVDPKLNLPAITKALEQAPTNDFEIVELPGLNHLFQQSATGLVQEYAELEETFNTRALELMTNWILEKSRKAAE
ncbi:MAG: alpha/beta hydrolase [bacterium]|nr:alpha/beta hydrolase [bacterium]